MLEPTLTYAILGVWSWSLLQFCFVLGAAAGGDGGEQGSRRRKKSAREGERAEQPNAECRQNCDEVVKFFGRVLFSIIVRPRPFNIRIVFLSFHSSSWRSSEGGGKCYPEHDSARHLPMIFKVPLYDHCIRDWQHPPGPFLL